LIDPYNLKIACDIIDKYSGKITFTSDFFGAGYLQVVDVDYLDLDVNDLKKLLKLSFFLWTNENGKVFLMLGED